MKNKKAFTLLEIILVVTIIGLLSGILFKAYVTMSQISFRVEQQKIVNQELLFVVETLQNLANTNDIDYSRYGDNDISLVDSKGMTNILYMSGNDGLIAVFSSGDCVSLNTKLNKDILDVGCSLILQKTDAEDTDLQNKKSKVKNIVLTKDLVYMTDALFKVIPFATDEMYVQNNGLCQSNHIACIGDVGFWFVANIYSRGYNGTWSNNVSVFVQQFFNI